MTTNVKILGFYDSLLFEGATTLKAGVWACEMVHRITPGFLDNLSYK